MGNGFPFLTEVPVRQPLFVASQNDTGKGEITMAYLQACFPELNTDEQV
jgi:hypothetical protein